MYAIILSKRAFVTRSCVCLTIIVLLSSSMHVGARYAVRRDKGRRFNRQFIVRNRECRTAKRQVSERAVVVHNADTLYFIYGYVHFSRAVRTERF